MVVVVPTVLSMFFYKIGGRIYLTSTAVALNGRICQSEGFLIAHLSCHQALFIDGLDSAIFKCQFGGWREK